MSGSNAQRRKTSERPSSRPCGSSTKAYWQKVPILISDVQPTARDEVIEITLADDGRKVRLRRDQCEFYPGKVFVPLWLWERLNATK